MPSSHSLPTLPSSSLPATPPSSLSAAELSDKIVHERAIDFASHSWDLATGGLKTLTAKRELPSLLERRPLERLMDRGDSVGGESVPRSYTFLLVILICLVLMLMSGGVVLFVMLQPY